MVSGRHAVVGVSVLALVGLVRFVVLHSFSIYDDAYIYFRYADNVLAGCGPTFNCGQPAVEGFTSPLFLGLLVAGGALTGDVEAWSQVLGPLCLAAALVAAILLPTIPALREGVHGRLSVAAAASVMLCLALDDYALHNAVSGLETGLAAAVVAMLAHSVLRRDVRSTCAWAVVSVLVRPECGVFVLALPLLPWLRTRRAVLGVAVGLAAIVLVRFAVFGDLMPNTYWAKSGGTSLHTQLGWAYLGEVVRDFPLVLLAPLALLDRARRREHAFLLVGAALWLGQFLVSGGDHFVYSRLAFPLVPTLVALAAIGLTRLRVPESLRRWHVLLVLAPGLAAGIRARVSHSLPEGHGFGNVERWAHVGRWLAEHHPEATIATIPVGAMAYHSRLPTLDLVGITSREVARSGTTVPVELMKRSWLGHERHDTAWVLEQAPDLIVSTKYRAVPWRDLREAKAGFFADWLLLQEIKSGRAPYEIYDAEIQPGVHWLMYRRR